MLNEQAVFFSTALIYRMKLEGKTPIQFDSFVGYFKETEVGIFVFTCYMISHQKLTQQGPVVQN